MPSDDHEHQSSNRESWQLNLFSVSNFIRQLLLYHMHVRRVKSHVLWTTKLSTNSENTIFCVCEGNRGLTNNCNGGLKLLPFWLMERSTWQDWAWKRNQKTSWHCSCLLQELQCYYSATATTQKSWFFFFFGLLWWKYYYIKKIVGI